MKKLKLDLDRIQVVSFQADKAERGRGTVAGFTGDPRLECAPPTQESCSPQECWVQSGWGDPC